MSSKPIMIVKQTKKNTKRYLCFLLLDSLEEMQHAFFFFSRIGIDAFGKRSEKLFFKSDLFFFF